MRFEKHARRMGIRLEGLLLLFCLGQLLVNAVDAGRKDWTIEKNASFWREQARLAIDERLKTRENTRVAKNVIMFLGDGMGVSTVTAGRIRKGQVSGELGEDVVTEMEQFAHLGLAKTYVLLGGIARRRRVRFLQVQHRSSDARLRCDGHGVPLRSESSTRNHRPRWSRTAQ